MNVDSEEIQKFNSLAHRWWDRDGEFRPLHDINGVRVNFLLRRAEVRGKDFLEVGCGGGILTETIALHGARTTGIDPATGPLSVAKLHAVESGLQDSIRYENTTAEEFVKTERERFDVVAALEILEHVPDFFETINALGELTRPGGSIFLSTINREWMAYFVAILGGEYVLNVLPKGTHDYKKFIKPHELAQAVREANLVFKEVSGYRYNPFSRTAKLTRSVNVHYIVHALKPN